MAHTSAYVPAPYNGISQSAPQVRLLEQAADLQDCIVDLPDGWHKRHPLSWLGEVRSSGVLSSAKVFKIVDPDDGSLKFLLMSREGSSTVARLYDALMASVSLTIDSGAQTYLNTAATPLKSTLRISQAVDYTFLTSTTNEVAIDSTLNTTRPHEALIWIKSGAYGKKYLVTITKSGGTARTGYVTTPSGDSANDSFWVSTDRIMQGIFADDYTYTDNGANKSSAISGITSDGFTITIKGAVVYVSHTTDFTVEVQDGQGGTAIVAAKDTVNNFSDLPADGVTDGFTVSVVPSRGDKQGAYYVTYNSNPSRGEQKWQETVGPSSQKGFDTTDMPVAVHKDGSGNWQLDRPAWKQRTVGDEDSAIDPLFVGSTIQDIGYAFGRLLILSAEETFLTAADDPYRIYPATLTTQIDSDPIALSPPSGDAKFKSVTTFSSNLLEGAYVTGLQQQCILRAPGDGPVTPTSVKLSRLSRYQLDDTLTDLRPEFNNNKVYLPVALGALYTGIREIQLNQQSGEALGDDLTAAQPKYLPRGLDVVASSETSYLAMYAKSGTRKIYAHLFRYNGDQRVQNGFFTWNIPTGWTVVDILCHGTLFYFFLEYSGRLCCFQMESNPQTLDDESNSTVLTKLDMRQREDQVASRTYSSSADTTTITSQVNLPTGAGYVSARASASAQNYPEGYLAEVVSQTATTITIKGDWTGDQQFYLGLGYTASWTPTQIFKFSSGDSRVVHGTLTVSRIWMDLKDATGLSVSVSNANRPARTKFLTQITFGSPSLFTGTFVVPIKGKNNQITITIQDDFHIGATISGFEWEGDFVSKAKRST